MKKTLLVVLLAGLVAAGGILLKKRWQEIAEAPVATLPVHSVRITLPETRTVSRTGSFLAELKAAKSAEISAKISGRIVRLPVHESQQVRQGEILVRIDDRELVAGIRALQSRLVAANRQRDYARAEHERNLELFRAGGISREKLEASEVTRSFTDAEVDDLQQKINSLESQLDYLNIRAPFDGIVGTILLREGDLAVPGRAILRLNSLPRKLTFRFVPETVRIETGQEVLHKGGKFGRVARLYNDASDGLAVAEVVPDRDIDLPVGSFLMLDVVLGTATGCSLPVEAILHRTQGVSVMLYQDGRFTELPVSVRMQDSRYALVSPCPTLPVALAPETRLSLLPGYGPVRILSEPKE
ncbi:hypothetical protein C2E25_06660 [Geothermobacter hydrogeniphilus]|uniref:Multidrug resistance protein MdtA-like barrel-sandwich hybrid domain-containing protein n=1 Tax=Geothermobacter hydrogeniphilus TaxID=1969733 RepID=A0A2K2HBE7_9BACT|nr:efflux RND transporter periplasmic adaptor subunit [Geothermobacter hydrogeniphilus]PNU20553.1 hypothetical protein C2E25_06660 [Geothermobacter hydrogeniphilus]